MTAAQKAAKANFKKAIEYRKKTGVSLKEAFAHVYGKKVGAAPKKKAAKKSAPKKAAKKVVKKAAPKKVAKKAAPKKHTKYGKVKAHTRRVAGVKKPESVHKDTKSHNVNIRVMSGYKKIGNLDEINKGDILVSHWGYDQTNVDFYTVIKKTGLGVTLAPMGEKIVEYNSNNMSGRVLPGEINYTAKTINRKIKKYSGGVYVSINTFATASKWNGQPQYFSNYA
jgi:hypothetical protein